MKLYEVTYKTWNDSFSGLNFRRMLAIGDDSNDAIQRAKKQVDKDARDFSATEIREVMGCKIRVE